jgi:hypothetical protein
MKPPKPPNAEKTRRNPPIYTHTHTEESSGTIEWVESGNPFGVGLFEWGKKKRIAKNTNRLLYLIDI